MVIAGKQSRTGRQPAYLVLMNAERIEDGRFPRVHRVSATGLVQGDLAADAELQPLDMSADLAAERHGHDLQAPATPKARYARLEGCSGEGNLVADDRIIIVGAEWRARPGDAAAIVHGQARRQPATVAGGHEDEVHAAKVVRELRTESGDIDVCMPAATMLHELRTGRRRRAVDDQNSSSPKPLRSKTTTLVICLPACRPIGCASLATG